MRSISTLFLFILILYSCEEVIQVDVVNTTPRISIDGHFNLFTQETPIRLDGGVRLTKSSDYFDLSVPLITDATVTITHLELGITYPLIYQPDTTFYIPENPLILTDFNSDYLLRIFYKGEIFESKTSFIPVAPIQSAIQGTKTFRNKDETEIIISFKDNASRDDYYLFDFGLDLYRSFEDRFFQGKEYGFSYFYNSDEVSVGDTITIKSHGIEKKYFTYFENILELSEDRGGPFQSIPSSSRGNIVNKTNPAQYPLGYFLISESDEISLIIIE